MQKLQIFMICAALGLTLASCGDASTAEDDGVGAGAGSAATADTGVATGDAAADVAVAPEVVAETAALEVAPTDVAKTCPGSPGCTCAENSQCDNGLCMDTPVGKKCAEKCIDKCENGFKCASVPGAGGDVQSICLPPHGKLCNPCTTSAACAALGQATPVCASHGDAGLFCGAQCQADSDCPANFGCVDVKTAEGTPAKTCTPKVDAKGVFAACVCSEAAIAQGLATTCSAPAKDDKGNIVGGCPGQRKCGKDGLTVCDAPTASPETCDGIDNDCNGKTDEGTCDDGNACTGDSCGKGADGKVGCQSVQLETPCDDKNACSEGDVCKAGACTAGANKECGDSNACTIDTCDPATGCAQANDDGSPCDDDNPCTVGDLCQTGKCVAGLPKECASTDACQTAKCDQAAGKCVFTDKQEGLPCNDNTACTQADVCKTGACNGELIPCNDGNPCTVDACDNAKGCTATDAEIACSDGDACSEADACKAGKCTSGAPKNCDDAESCTLDTCDKASGDCKNAAVGGCGGNCNNDADCNDSNPCTTDSCSAGKCAVAANTAKCDDGDVCTEADVCASSVCAGGPLSCEDKNPCTTDSCEVGTGCANVANSNNCEDGNACTIGDSCADKGCKAGAVTNCDDKNLCTDDACDSKTGKCGVVNNSAACSDDNACTTGDVCTTGACKPGVATVCDDKNLCTDDKCNPATGACAVTNNTATCSDGNACTVGDICATGTCKAGANKVCDDKDGCTLDVCNKTTGACSASPIVGCGGNCKVVADCDDKNACTTDACTSGKCANAVNTLACDDKDGCTVNDVCNAGVCKPGTKKPCNDGNLCSDDSCDSVTGDCKATNNILPCNDNNACTLSDVCAGGVCAPGAPMNCDDKNPCTTGDTCKLGACVVGIPVVCDDKNGCTTDSCDKLTGKCLFLNNTSACTDSNACTTGDVCTLGGCKAGAATNCIDNQVCTTDTCDKVSGKCSNVGNALACTDNDDCTVGDACAFGLCKAGTPTVCDDKNQCTTDTCDKVTGKCVLVNTVLPCNDGTLCTSGDKCDGAGKCGGGVNVVCKLALCAPSACDGATGLCKVTNAPVTTLCDDLQVCTKGDHCEAGKCASGPWDNTCGCQTAATCDDKNACTTDTCVSNKCVFTITASAACDDGDVCSSASKCDASGKCIASAFFDCKGADDQCNTGTCLENAGAPICKKVPKLKGTVCTDAKFCTTGEMCDGLGACNNGLPVSCGKPAQCYQSLCTEAAKGCSTPFQPIGSACTDKSICTDTDICNGAGVCKGTLLDSCTPVLATFNPASPSINTATAANGTATATTNVTLYPTANCTGTAYNAVGVTANPAFSVGFSAAKQACTSVSAIATDAAGTKSKCSKSLVFNNYSCTQCPCGDADYIRRFGGSKADTGAAVAVDTAGSAYVASNTDGAIPPGVALGGYDAVLTKHDTAGARVWTTQFGSAGDDTAVAVAIDNAGAVWVVGTTTGDIDGAGPLVAPAAGDTSVYFARFDAATGKQSMIKLWATATRKETAIDMQWDAQNTRLVALVQSATLGGGGLSPQLVVVAPATGVITKLWEYIEDGQNKNPVGIHVDVGANVYVSGRTQFGIAGALSKTGAAGGGIYLYKVSTLGKTVWLQQWGSAAFDYAGGVVTDGAGKVYATGWAQGLATGAQVGATYAGSTGIDWGHYGDMIVAQFDEVSGKQNWLYQSGTSGGDAGLHLEFQTGKSGGVIITGVTTGNMETLGGTSKLGLQDVFVAKVSQFGTLVSTRTYGTAAYDGAGKTMRAGAPGNLYVSGYSDADWIGQSPDACVPQTTREVFLGRWCVQ
ncbi:MAG: hypothetical protein EXR77_16615 [Myxococcales bacterium]|nr:hypothetical protein [Myxococcales bacterium]